MEGKLCDLCGKNVKEEAEDWADWNVRNILGAKDICKKCFAEFRKLVKDWKISKKRKK